MKLKKARKIEMNKIRIITDSGSDITPKRAEELGIRLIPISFTFDGEKYYRSGIDMPLEEFYERLSDSSVIPKTTQVSPVEMEDVFNEELDSGYDTLIYVSISSNGSGMYQNAVLTAREVMENRGGEIIVVDSQGFTCIYGAPVIHAAKMVSAGESKEAVLDYLNDAFSTMRSLFLVGDLKHLKKGGRINTATLLLANMLDIKPVLTVSGGLVVQKDKLRGNKRHLRKLVALAADEGVDLSNRSAIIVHTLQPEKRDELKAELEEKFPGVRVYECPIGTIIGSHGGGDLVGFVYSEKYDFDDYEV